MLPWPKKKNSVIGVFPYPSLPLISYCYVIAILLVASTAYNTTHVKYEFVFSAEINVHTQKLKAKSY